MGERMKVIIGYDGSHCAEAAIKDLCRAGLSPDAEITVVSVADLSAKRLPVSEFDLHSLASRRALSVIEQAKAFHERKFQKVKKSAARAADYLRPLFPEGLLRYRVLDGKPAAELLLYAAEWKPDLIVVGSHGRTAIGRFFLGSVSQKVAVGAHCSVRVARGARRKNGAPTKIIAGAISLTGAEAVIRAIERRVWSSGTKVSLIKVDDGFSAGRVSAVYPYADAIFERFAGELRAAGLGVSVDLQSGDPKTVLLAEAERQKADAIFVAAGSNDGSGIDVTAASLITGANCTVEIVR